MIMSDCPACGTFVEYDESSNPHGLCEWCLRDYNQWLLGLFIEHRNKKYALDIPEEAKEDEH
jgi:endogenous inhibitor of DNA gyrase (YacG/DUF329 family)